MTLADLAPGEVGIVDKIVAEEVLFRRLLDLGLVPGTQVQARFASPSGDPRAYAFRGAVVALRLVTALGVKLRQM